MSQKIIIESLAMDLKRVALGLHRGSLVMAKRFAEEAIKRSDELKNENNQYLIGLVNKMRKSLAVNSDRSAEDALMYSVLFQNYSLKNYK